MNSKLQVVAALLAGAGCFLVGGCRKATAPAVQPVSQTEPAAASQPMNAGAAPASSADEYTPVVKGIPFQLSLARGVFGFCDDSGAQRIDLATGKQSAGSGTCDRQNEVVQSSCDDRVTIYGQTDGGQDTLSYGSHNYVLPGHSRECDLDASLLIVSSVGGVEMIDTAANTTKVVDKAGGDKVAIGSGWVAWSSLDDKRPLRLMKTGKAVAGATPAKG